MTANSAQPERDAEREDRCSRLGVSLPQATLDALCAHIAVLDEDGVIIAVNLAWRAFAEANPPCPSNVNEGASYLAVCDAAKGPDADVAAGVAAGIRAVIRGDYSTFEMEYPCHSPDIMRWFVCRVSRFPGSGTQRVVVAHVNTTERKEAEQDLQISEMRYRRLFESAKDGILILDAETGRVVDVNPFLIQLLGISREVFLGKAIWELGFFADIVASQDSFAELQQMEYIRYEDKPLKTADGRQVDVEFVSNVYLVNRQKVIQCNIRDITARKHAEESLREKEHLLSESQRLGHIGSWLWHLTGDISWSDEVYRLYGVSRESFTPDTESMIGLLDADDRPAMRAWIAACAEGKKVRELEYRVTWPDGTTHILLGRGEAAHDAGKRLTHMAGTVQDITRQKQAEAEHEELQAQLIQAQKLESIGTLAGGVAHEINNPVMGIMNYAQLIVDELGPDSLATGYAVEIGMETQRVATIVKNLLSFARVDKDTYKSPAGLCDIVEDTLSLIRAVIRHDQITLEVHVPADLPRILCRSQQIRQVLMNLLTNARDALNQKYPGHDANKRIVISAKLISDYGCRNQERRGKRRTLESSIRLSVEDRGMGIPQDLRDRIFDPFFSTKPHHKGTGLGLSISHGIVRDHGGSLSVESEVGQWTRFHVDLPVADGAP